MIVYCCPDLIFATRIGSTATELGITSRPARHSQALQARLDCIDDGKAHEPVTGVIVDLDLPEAIDLIAQARAHQADLPIVAYGPHVVVDRLEQARTAGADFVMPRGAFTGSLPDILERLR